MGKPMVLSIHPRTCLVVVLALPLIAAPGPGDSVDARWKLVGSDVGIWDVYDLPRVEGGMESPRTPNLILALYGYQIDARGQAHFPVHSVDEIPYDIALRAPVGKVREGQKVKRRLRYDRIRLHRPIDVSIVGEVTEVSEETFRFEARFEGNPSSQAPSPPGDIQWSTKFSGDLALVFDVERGAVISSEVRVDSKSIHRDDGIKEGAPPPKELSLYCRFRLRTIHQYDPNWIEQSWKLNTPVSNAIDKGVEWVRKQIQGDGTYGVHQEKYPHGLTCLSALTLLICGAERDDPFISTLMDKIRSFDPKRTYEIALALMAMETFYAPADEVTDVHTGKREIPFRREVSREDRAWMQGLTDRLVSLAKRQPDGWGWSYSNEDVYVDLSNTQYAALGLLSAWRCGVRIPEEVWVGLARGVFRHQFGNQKVRLALGRSLRGDPKRTRTGKPKKAKAFATKARGFSYYPGAKEPKGSMTCGGISTLRIVRDILLFEKGGRAGSIIKNIDTSIQEGWGWMSVEWAVDRHPPDHERNWLHYFLYSIERAGVLSGVDTVNGHDWFFEGAQYLVATQYEDGHWVDRTGELYNTCFALLFLKRGTIPLPKPEETGAGR